MADDLSRLAEAAGVLDDLHAAPPKALDTASPQPAALHDAAAAGAALDDLLWRGRTWAAGHTLRILSDVASAPACAALCAHDAQCRKYTFKRYPSPSSNRLLTQCVFKSDDVVRMRPCGRGAVSAKSWSGCVSGIKLGAYAPVAIRRLAIRVAVSTSMAPALVPRPMPMAAPAPRVQPSSAVAAVQPSAGPLEDLHGARISSLYATRAHTHMAACTLVRGSSTGW
jgi:hypothetical protein